MVARPLNCDSDRLRHLLEDRLGEEEQAAISRHLENCASCRGNLEQMAAERRWWDDARLLADAAPALTPTDLELPGNDRSTLDFLDPPTEPGALGTLGTYEVTEVIGRGGMGVVLKALDRPLGRFVAIKVLAPELATSAIARRRFAREARAAAAISHDHIVAIYEVDETRGGLPFLVMPCIAGRSLQERLDRTGPLELRAILRIGMQAAAGLAAAHAVGLVHRDIKPANILLENGVERVKLTDFGLARAVDDAGVTQSGVVAGTPQYMAPEQARGEPVDARADLFSLGSVLYALCTGRPPFRGETTMGVLRRVCEDTPPPIRTLNPEIPDWLEAIVARLQAKDPAERFSTAAEVAELFGRCLAYLERPDAQQPPFLAGTSPKPRRRARSGVMIAAAVVVAALAGLGVSEASGVTKLVDFVATVLRIKTPEGTLVIVIDDPAVKVRVDGEEVVFSGADPEIRLSLRAGRHQVEKIKGNLVERELITITRGGKQSIRAVLEPANTAVSEVNATPTAVAVSPHLAALNIGPIALPTIVQCVDVSPDGKTLATGCLDGTIRLWDPSTGAAKGVLTGHTAQVRGLAFSPDGRTLASVGGYFEYNRREDPGEAKLWDVVEGRLRYDLLGHTGLVWSVAFSPDGKTLATGSWDRTARIWDVDSGQLRTVLKGHKAAVRCVAFSPAREGVVDRTSHSNVNGPTVATGGLDGDVSFWHTDTGLLWRTQHLSDFGVGTLAFSPDNRTLALSPYTVFEVDRADEVILLDLSSWSVRARLKGHCQGVMALAFSPDGKTLASGGGRLHGTGDIFLWDLASGSERARTYELFDWVKSLAFTPDGKTLISSGGIREIRGEIRFWDPIHLPAMPQMILEQHKPLGGRH